MTQNTMPQTSEGKKIRALVSGHTGATGKALLDQLVASPDVEHIVAVGRRINEKYANHPKVTQHVVPDMTKLGEVDLSIAEGCNAAFSTIGTPFMDVANKKKQDAYRMVDFGIATTFAKFAKDAGADFISFITGEGTDGDSDMNMYVVKRDTENFVRDLGFDRVAIMRPGFLYRGKDSSIMEKLMLARFLGTPVAKVANAMVWAAFNQTEQELGYTTQMIKDCA
jgi:oxidoreductase